MISKHDIARPHSISGRFQELTSRSVFSTLTGVISRASMHSPRMAFSSSSAAPSLHINIHILLHTTPRLVIIQLSFRVLYSVVVSFNFFEPLKSKRISTSFKPVSMASKAIWGGITFFDSFIWIGHGSRNILYVRLLVVSLVGVTWVLMMWPVISASFPL